MFLLSCLQKADSIGGSEQAKAKRLTADALKDAKNLVYAELSKKIIAPLMRIPQASAPVPVPVDGGVELRLPVKTDADAQRIARSVEQKAKFLKKKESKELLWTFSLNPDSFVHQTSRLKKFGGSLAASILSKILVKLAFSKEIPTETPAQSTGAPRPSLAQKALLPKQLGLVLNKPYTQAALDKAVDKGVQKLQNAAPVLNAVLHLAREGIERPVMVAHPMAAKDIAIAQNEFLPIAAAVSALHENPKLTVSFSANGEFVLYSGKRPTGRFGKSLQGILLKDAVELCQKTCGQYGNPDRLLDVLDAEGQRKEKQIAELFNDLAKHIATHSSGPAAKAAKRLAKAAGIEGKPDWNGFKKVVAEAAMGIRMTGMHPFTDMLRETVEELNAKRNVIDDRQIRWESDILRMNLDWLGSLIADILEEEVAVSAKARQALSCTVDWLQNAVQCELSIRYLGSAGLRIQFKPCQKISPKNWRLELQGIMKDGPSWSRAS